MMPAIGESIFDVLYLIFAITSGIILLVKAKGRTVIALFGWMTLLLGAGDSFHLIPRVLNYWTDADYTAALGVGTWMLFGAHGMLKEYILKTE